MTVGDRAREFEDPATIDYKTERRRETREGRTAGLSSFWHEIGREGVPGARQGALAGDVGVAGRRDGVRKSTVFYTLYCIKK